LITKNVINFGIIFQFNYFQKHNPSGPSFWNSTLLLTNENHSGWYCGADKKLGIPPKTA